MKSRIAAGIFAILIMVTIASAMAERPGSLKWRFWAGASVDSSPAIGEDGTLYIGCSDFYLYAVYGERGGAGSGPLAHVPA